MDARLCVVLALVSLSGHGCSGADEPRKVFSELARISGVLSYCLGGDFLATVPELVAVREISEGPSAGSFSKGMECLAAAANCEAAYSCLGIEVGDPCTPDTFPKQCDGDLISICWSIPALGEHRVVTSSCGGFLNPGQDEQVCLLDENGKARCAFGPCTSGSGVCEGQRAISCTWDVAFGVNCAQVGKTCALSYVEGLDEALPFCSTGNPCEASGCDGTEMVACKGGQEALRWDCALFDPGMRCVESDEYADGTGNWLHCTSFESQEGCPLHKQESSCVGNVIVGCYMGVRYEFDCSFFSGAVCSEGNCAKEVVSD